MLFSGLFAFSQNTKSELAKLVLIMQKKQNEISNLSVKIDSMRLSLVAKEIQELGWASADTPIIHQSMALAYSEKHEQAQWVSHIILPQIMEGKTSRTNDFRRDPLVKTGSAEEADYFLKYLQPDSSYKYDGFGYDRGHLAPSADFRWNQTALSESYFYSNMSPQLPEFNRGGWAELEGLMRAYIYRNLVPLYVVTGPVLEENLPVIERSVNKVSIPKQFFKVVMDRENERGIAFLMPNKKIEKPLEMYSLSIDEIEKLTGFDFFNELPDNEESKIEKQTDYHPWLSEAEEGDVIPLHPSQIKKGFFNTLQSKYYMNTGKKICVCGTVVSTYKSKKGNVFVNLDKKFPKTIFSVSIWAKNATNFSYAPEIFLKNKTICVSGKVRDYQGIPNMSCENEKNIKVIELTK